MDDVVSLLATFSCPRNLDVEQFLTDPGKGIRMENADKSRTFLIVADESADGVDVGDILAYFTLATKHIDISRLSKRLRRSLDGMRPANSVSCYLIGQLGKNFACSSAIVSVNLNSILSEAVNFIVRANSLVGMRVIILECSEDMKDRYGACNFRELPILSGDGLVTMFQIITRSVVLN